jgi:predicted Fe-S protein YdhL (DUF1289 family)
MQPLPRDLAQWRRLADQAASACPVPSPCVNLCRLDTATGACAGCGRSLEEISQWSRMAEEDKRQVWAQLPTRQHALAVSRTRGLVQP